MQLRWSHAVLRVRELETMLAFYTGLLGFRVSDRGPLAPPGPPGATPGDGPELVFLTQVANEHHQLAMIVARGAEEATSLEHMAFRVDSIAEVKEMLRRVREDPRIADGQPVTHGNAVSLYFKDPEGNGIEVFCDTPWHVRQPVLMFWNPEHTDEQILDEIRQHIERAPEFQPLEVYQAKQARRLNAD